MTTLREFIHGRRPSIQFDVMRIIYFMIVIAVNTPVVCIITESIVVQDPYYVPTRPLSCIYIEPLTTKKKIAQAILVCVVSFILCCSICGDR